MTGETPPAEQLSARDYANILSALGREHRYWRTTRRQLRPSERVLAVTAVQQTYDKVKAIRDAEEARIAAEVERVTAERKAAREAGR